MRKWSRRALSVATATALSVVTILGNGQSMNVEAASSDDSGKIYLSDEDIATLTEEPDYSFTRNSVHDPSVIDGKNGYYYVFGSHMGVSKTNDFMNWTSVADESTSSSLFGIWNEDGSITTASYNDAFRNNQVKKITVLVDGVAKEVDFGDYDASAWNTSRDNYTVQGNMWAPDIVYNETMGKWCMYLSLNGSKWNSSIILLTADDIEGPYVYQGPVVYSGFSNTVAECSFENSDLELVLGDLEALPEKYNKADNGSWGDYWPHAIDPCVFFDEEGDLWMSYGSWSGGIYMLELDETTGLRDYTVTYESDFDSQGKNVTTDAYFGKKIAGGYYVSGEGSYIQKIGNYYYLFMSYGFYSPEGGYNMRIFRSENPDGPYVDTTGKSAVYSGFALNYNAEWGTIKDYRGDRLMTNYQWNTMSVAEVSQGHNSAIVDEDGRAYVVYHTKYNDGSVGHALRVHELFTNENGWIVASPYEYTGDEKLDYQKSYDKADIVGNYEVIVHSYEIGYDSSAANNIAYVTPVIVSLQEDGTVSGTYSGTWAEQEGTPYATLVLDGKTYQGVFAEQTVDATGMKTMCFSVVDETTGLNVWGSKNVGDAAIVALNATTADVPVPSKTFTDIELPSDGVQGATISWTSNNEAVLSSDGKVAAVTENTTVILTKTIAKGNYVYQKDYEVTVMAPQGEEKILLASYFGDQAVDLSKYLDGSLSVANPYAKTVTTGLDLSGGATIAFDVVPTGDTRVLATILGFGDSGKLYFTPGSYLGYNALNSYFDANLNNYTLVTDYIGLAYAETNQAVHVELVLDQSGFDVYVNGTLAYDESILQTENGKGDLSNYKKMIKWLQESATKVYFGFGSWWSVAGFDEANILLSNVEFWANAVSSEEASPAICDKTVKSNIDLTTNDSIEIMDNPFYDTKMDELYVDYTINFAEDAAKNGWDGIFSFYNSQTGGRVSFQTAPYICYNEANDTWMDLKALDGNDMYAFKNMEKGVDYHVTMIVTRDGAQFSVDGKVLPIVISGSVTDYGKLLDFISECDQFTWGVGQGQTAYWWTEICTLKDVTIASANPVLIEKEQLEITSSDAIEIVDNPAYGKEAKKLDIKYTISFAEAAAKNGYDGIFSFFNSKTQGRISIQTAPYICYNEANGTWMDLKCMEGDDHYAVTLSKQKDYTFELIVTEEELHFFMDGTELPVTVSGSGASYEDLLSFIGECDQFTWGVGQGQTAYWWTELCTLKDVEVCVYTVDQLASDEKDDQDADDNTGADEDTEKEPEEVITQIETALGTWVSGNYRESKNPVIGENEARIVLSEELVADGKLIVGNTYQYAVSNDAFYMYLREVRDGACKSIYVRNGERFTVEEGASYYAGVYTVSSAYKNMTFADYVELFKNGMTIELTCLPQETPSEIAASMAGQDVTWISGNYGISKATISKNVGRISLSDKFSVDEDTAYTAEVTSGFRVILRVTEKDSSKVVETKYLVNGTEFMAEADKDYYITVYATSSAYKNIDFETYVAMMKAGELVVDLK